MKKDGKRIIIGENKRFGKVYKSSNTMNDHIAMFGLSGSGKSTELMNLTLQFHQQDCRVVTINWRKCLDMDGIMPKLQKEYLENRQKIDVEREGLKLPLFTPMANQSGYVENQASVVQRVTNLLSKTCNITESQKACVRNAVENTYQNEMYSKNGIREIGFFLEAQDYKTALSAASRLSSLCAQNCFRDGDFLEEIKDKIIEVDVNGIQYEDQVKVVYALLDHILRMANAGKFINRPLTVVIDECQNLDFSSGSTMAILLNESRKMGINLVMAAPRMSTLAKNDMRIMQQCGSILHFMPIAEDRRKIARQIDPKKEDAQVYNLANLKRGQFVASGEFETEDGKDELPSAITLETYFSKDVREATKQ